MKRSEKLRRQEEELDAELEQLHIALRCDPKFREKLRKKATKRLKKEVRT